MEIIYKINELFKPENGLSNYMVGDDILLLPPGFILDCHVIQKDEIRGMNSFRKMNGQIVGRNTLTGEDYEPVDFFVVHTFEDEE